MTSDCFICPHCLTAVHGPKLEPLYTLRQAAALIPYHYPSLVSYLRRYKQEYPAVYRAYRDKGILRRVRLLTGTEIRQLRKRYIYGPGKERVL